MHHKKRGTLRFKLTLVTVSAMALMCLLLSAVSLSASSIIAQAQKIQAQDLTLAMESILPGSTAGQDPILDIMTPALSTQAAQQSFNAITITAMLLILCAGGGFVYYYVKKELCPLEALALQVQSLNAENLSTPLAVQVTGDEVEKLSLAIGDMAARVSDAYVMQKAFSSSAAHELRTPLASMQSQIEVFKLKDHRSQAEYDKLVDTLGRNTHRLSELVQELLQLTNQTPVELGQKVELHTLCEEVAMDLAALAQEKGVSITVEGQAVVTGNDCLLQRAVFNLMQNAVKYNLPGGQVAVTLRQNEKSAVLQVADTGIGIPPQARPHVFEVFYRADRSRNRETGGSGLGLAIVQRIALQHGGQVTLEENAPRGTLIQLTLPAER